MRNYSDYLVFVDESGDHNLEAHDPKYPIFVLAFLAIKKSHYCDFLLPEFTKLKLKYFPTDNVIFHEREIRKQKNPFVFLQNESLRALFMKDLNELIRKADFNIVAVAMRKDKFVDGNLISGFISDELHPYHLGVKNGIEEVEKFLLERESGNKKVVITFESRGKKEDVELRYDFLKMAKKFCDFELEMITKSSNSCGLQIVDLIARPLGISLLNPRQPNRSFQILKTKIYSISQFWVS